MKEGIPEEQVLETGHQVRDGYLSRHFRSRRYLCVYFTSEAAPAAADGSFTVDGFIESYKAFFTNFKIENL